MEFSQKKQIIRRLKDLGLSQHDNPFKTDIQDCLWDDSSDFDGFMYLERKVPCNDPECLRGHYDDEDHYIRVNLTPVEVAEIVSDYLTKKAIAKAQERERGRQILSLLRGLNSP